VLRREAPALKGEPENFIYGETPLFTLKQLLKEAGVTAQDHFYDLGCGRGKTVFGAYYLYGIPATGIELVKGLVQLADRLRLKLRLDKLSFILGDFNEVDLSPGTIFLICGTTWSGALIEQTARHLAVLKQPVKIISLSFPLSGFPVIKSKDFWFSWGRVRVFFQTNKKIEENSP
jgi:SAM-dependent methyltransferase